MSNPTWSAPFEISLGDGLRAVGTGEADSPLLPRFFAGYDRAFVLPDEREEIDGFRICLGMNERARHWFGRTHFEMVAVLEDEEGRDLGGINFLATAMSPDRSPRVTVALNYIFVDEALRGRGLSRRALEATRRLALIGLNLDPKTEAPALFIEQNDPLRLSDEAYEADTRHSGLDQVDRLAIWARMGAKVVDFPYVQPALSVGQQPDDSLIYAAIDYPHPDIEPGLLHDHLQSFFAISVLKGKPEAAGGLVERQLSKLVARDDNVALMPMQGALEALRSGRVPAGIGSFRDLAREVGGINGAGGAAEGHDDRKRV